MQSPFDLFGPLLDAVQSQGIFGDGKAFVDARPKRPVDAIMLDFAGLDSSNEGDLLAFVHANFVLPVVEAQPWPAHASSSLSEHIRATWSLLARAAKESTGGCSSLSVGHPHVVPGGRFRELYYWDSFFTMLGLLRDGEIELATGMVDTMTDLIERFGHIPNGTRTYYLGRSQPPLYHMMVNLLEGSKPHSSARRLAAMKAEHAWWMRGSADLAPGTANFRVAKLKDGSVLNRYWDPHSRPRDESWREDVATAALGKRPREEVFRELRAGAESGWDFSSRWLDGSDLSTIRTTTILPADLNAFLYSLEMAIAATGDQDSEHFLELAGRRLVAMHSNLWSKEHGCFADFDLTTDETREPTAACLAPLLCQIATPEQAKSTARLVEKRMLAPGGLRTTLKATDEQWDMPNGWAPLQWIAVQGLLNYGISDLAAEIAKRWVETVSVIYRQTGFTHEKYDIETRAIGGGGEYDPQIGFGWTNGVTREFIHRFGEPAAECGAYYQSPVAGEGRGDSCSKV